MDEQREWIAHCRYIPLRLTEDERKLLVLLEAGLNVSEYTDDVDTISRRSKTTRIIEGLRDMISIASGLYICSGLKKGEKLVSQGLESPEAEEFLQKVFEVGRRFKIMNPSKMRSSYGKLMYMLQDAMPRSSQEAIGMNLWKPLEMVTTYLDRKGAIKMLLDSRCKIATMDISSMDEEGHPRKRADIDHDLEQKRSAERALVNEFATGDDALLTQDEVERVLASLADANNYLAANVRPVERILSMLTTNFTPASAEKGFSLALGGGGLSGIVSSYSSSYYGRGYGMGSSYGARAKLSHDHKTHFTFVFQTFTLWREIMKQMYKLWCLADDDLLCGGEGHSSGYQLWNTGQGLNRVQRCPKVAAEMSRLLDLARRQVGGSWVGLSVVHLGDRDVPNALIFIDKYTQVPRILAPIVEVIDAIDSPNSAFNSNPAITKYVESQFGSLHKLKLTILCDYFKHGFDGDGDDGGSCIDGRLTSTWNWCSRVVKKPYYHCFNLAGFQGFDGDWKD